MSQPSRVSARIRSAERVLDALAERIPVSEENASEEFLRALLRELPVALYATDDQGRITYYNDAAVRLWGRAPVIGEDWWCGSWKLFWPDGRVMEHAECPMAIALKTREAVRGRQAIAERPDGSRFPFVPYPTPLFSEEGELIGAVNLLLEISDRVHAEASTHQLAAIVDSAEDAIISKDTNGIILSWNAAAERVFGYAPEEIVGKPVLVLIPEDRLHEEETILGKIRAGERVE